MNEKAQKIALDEIARSENKLELGLKFIEIVKKAVITDFAKRKCKPLQFASQLPGCSDPFMSGDHPETMLAFLEKNLLVSADDDDEPSKTESISENTGVKSEVFSADDPIETMSEAMEEHVKNASLINQKIISEVDAWEAIKPCRDLPRKSCELLRLLSQDLLVADLKISLYITACNNLRVQPFPTDIVDETPDGLLGLALVNNLIPPVEVIQLLLSRNTGQLNSNVINVVHWLMVQLRQPKLVNLSRENFESVYDRVEYTVNLQNPSHIIKIMVNNLSSNYLQWQAAKGQHPTKFAFYGVRVEHIHSLVHLGLYPFQKVNGPHGKGVYLTSDLKSCMDSTPPAWVWGKSAIGTQLQTVAVVEFIDRHPQVYSYQDPNFIQQPGQGKPMNYYIPKTNLIQARYLLLFVRDSHRPLVDPVKPERGKLKKVLLGGVFVGSYLTLCYVAWKSIKNPNLTTWDVLTNKFKNIPFLERIPHFLRSSTE